MNRKRCAVRVGADRRFLPYKRFLNSCGQNKFDPIEDSETAEQHVIHCEACGLA